MMHRSVARVIISGELESENGQNNNMVGVELGQARHSATSRARKRVGEIKWRLRHRFQRLK